MAVTGFGRSRSRRRRITRRHMLRERPGANTPGHGLGERSIFAAGRSGPTTWKNRAQFFNVASAIMRLGHARALQSGKRGSGTNHLPLDELILTPAKSAALVRLDDALEALAQIDPRKARAVELRYLGGLSVEETAAALDVHPYTVVRDWSLAKAWLAR
jgi:RNA polymerase sigma-70 factor, ECF subfamily